MAITKTIPKSEDGRGVLCLVNGETYKITQNSSKVKNAFTLWKIVPGGFEKLGTADIPQELEKQIGLCVFPDESEKTTRRRSVKKN